MQQDEEDISDEEYTPESRRRADSRLSTSDLDESSSNEDTWQTESTMLMGGSGKTTGDSRSPVPPSGTIRRCTRSRGDYSPRGSVGRTSFIGSSLTSSSTAGPSPSSAGVFYSSPYPFDTATCDYSQSPTSPIDTPAAGKATQTMRASQISPPDHGLSLATMVDASMGN